MVRSVSDQARSFVAFLAPLSQDEFERPSVLPHWDVRTLTAHQLVNHAQLFEALDCPTGARPLALHSYLRGLRSQRHRINQLAVEVADNETGGRLASQLRHSVAEMVSYFANETIPQTVATSTDPLSITDYVRRLIIEWVIHSDDLSRSVPEREPMALDPSALADAVRTLADAFAKGHPGRSIEVRVPPYAAIQCGSGSDEPTHTRGTPPTVVETDPQTFLRVATGRTLFRDELAGGTIEASGVRRDLTPMLPLLS